MKYFKYNVDDDVIFGENEVNDSMDTSKAITILDEMKKVKVDYNNLTKLVANPKKDFNLKLERMLQFYAIDADDLNTIEAQAIVGEGAFVDVPTKKVYVKSFSKEPQYAVVTNASLYVANDKVKKLKKMWTIDAKTIAKLVEEKKVFVMDYDYAELVDGSRVSPGNVMPISYLTESDIPAFVQGKTPYTNAMKALEEDLDPAQVDSDFRTRFVPDYKRAMIYFQDCVKVSANKEALAIENAEKELKRKKEINRKNQETFSNLSKDTVNQRKGR